MSVNFLNPIKTDGTGLVRVGPELNLELLREAYRAGVFPWPQDGIDDYLWFCPDPRGVLFLDEVHWSRSFLKWKAGKSWTVTFNKEFKKVMQFCAEQKRMGQIGTWIRPEMHAAYFELHQVGEAYSVETWDHNGDLVGGLYGVIINGAVAGESMFHIKPNASKLALWHLLELLRVEGHEWLDTQMVTEFMAQLGGRYISRNDFLRRLSDRQKLNLAHSTLSKR